MNINNAAKELKKICNGWYLRFYCRRFAILVDKETGDYINLYRDEFLDPFAYDIIPDIMDPYSK